MSVSKFNIAVLGESGCGKTAFINRLVSGNWTGRHVPTPTDEKTEYQKINYDEENDMENESTFTFTSFRNESLRKDTLMGTFFSTISRMSIRWGASVRLTIR